MFITTYTSIHTCIHVYIYIYIYIHICIYVCVCVRMKCICSILSSVVFDQRACLPSSLPLFVFPAELLLARAVLHKVLQEELALAQ